MATGFLDANNIWQYGEDDVLSPWSGSTTAYMNKGMTSVTNVLTPINAAWTAHSPTLGNWALGNGSLTGRFKQVGKIVHARGALVVGSTTTFLGSPVITVPVGPLLSSWTDAAPAGACLLTDTSASLAYPGVAVPFGSLTVALRTPSGAFVNATGPFTWTTGDVIGWTITYEAA